MHNGHTIINTTKEDLDEITWLFDRAMDLQGKNGYQVWKSIDKAALEKDIENSLHYKIVTGNNIACIFSMQHNDPFIWRERDQNNAIYLHRIVVHPEFKGQRLFGKVLNWSIDFVLANRLSFVRMDTWAENEKIITYYKSFGFELVEYFKTPDAAELPVQNRNLNVALLELALQKEKGQPP